MTKIGFVTSLQPETHYSRYLIGALEEKFSNALDVLVYADKDPRNTSLTFKHIKLVWTPTFAFPFQITRQVLADKPDLVHIQHEINMYGGPFTAILFPLMLCLLRWVGARIVVTVHSVVPLDQIDADFMRTFSWSPSPLLVLLVRLVFNFIYRGIDLSASKIIVHSNYMGGLLEKNYGVKAEKIVVIPIGVAELKSVEENTTRIKREWFSLIENKKTLLYFGYIIRRKGLEYLIDAFQQICAEHTDHVLVLAGGELDYQRDYAQQLRDEVVRRGLSDRIVFTSFISGAEIESLFARCEFVVLPYTYSISSSLPLSLAMQYGKPVIATRLGTLAEEVEENVDGLLVTPRDVSSLAQAMRQLMQADTLLQRLSDGTHAKALRRSWVSVAESTVQVYRELWSELDI
jgi:glycosyltransferase involved in cell wall biosynthesis